MIMFVRMACRPLVAGLICFLILTSTLFPPLFAQPEHWETALYQKSRNVDGFQYVALHDVADILKVHTYYSNKVRKAILYLDANKITVTAFNPFVLVGREVVQMPMDARYEQDEIFLPTKFFIPILRSAVGDKVQASVEGDSGANITGIYVDEKVNGTLIRIHTTQAFPQSNISTRYSRKWLYLDILGGRIDEQTLSANIEEGLVRKFVPVQQAQMAQLSFRLKQDISESKINLTQHQNEIWISIPAKVTAESSILEKLKHDQEKWRIDKIVIDPGHGGKDPGALGPRGTYEKTVVLGIAKKLKRLIQKRMKDVTVLMTRDSDRYISLKERTQLANKQKAKLFISLHANWNRNSTVNGATAYFLGLAKSEESLEIAQRENAVIKYDNPQANSNLSEENIILATIAQNAYNKESQDFAAMIQEALSKRTRLRNRGVRQAGFYVLVGASMPNVLIETAFISNKREEKLLRTKSFQQKVAESIFESIKKFKHRYEWTVSTN